MADRNEFDELIKSRQQYGRLTVISLFCLALLHGIHPFFFTFFFWVSAGLLVLTLYYHIILKRNPSSTSHQSRQPQFSSSSFSGWFKGALTDSTKARNIGIAIAVIVGFFTIIIIVSVVFSGGEGSENESYNEYYVDSQIYDQAMDEYNQSNYERTIEILRPILVRGNQDSQAMLLLGDGYYANENLDSAYIWYNKAYEFGQRSAILSQLMGYILDTKGNTFEAISFYKEALSMGSSIVDIYNRLAELEPESSSWYQQKAQQFKEN